VPAERFETCSEHFVVSVSFVVPYQRGDVGNVQLRELSIQELFMFPIMSWFASLLAVVSLVAAGFADDEAPAPATYTLRYQFEPGQELRYVSLDESTFDVHQSEAETSVECSTKAWKHYRVLKVNDDGTVTLELVLDHVQMRAEGDGRTIEYDSRLPGPPPPNFALLPIGRAVATITVSPRGEIVKYESLVPTEGLNTDTLERDLQVLTILPEEAVQVGDSWREIFDATIKLEGKLTRKAKLQRILTLTAVEDGEAVIDLQTIVLTPLDGPEQEAQVIQKTPSGALRIDVARGIILHKQTRLDNQVVGFSGPGSKLHVRRTVTEELTTESDTLVGQTTTP
jgi:hypothetical protein